MEGKGPYRIYDPGGGTQEEAAAAFERLVEENNKLKEKMQGIKSLGELLEESQLEASRLRQKVEDLVKDNEILRSSSSLSKLAEMAGDLCACPEVQDEDLEELKKVAQKMSSSGSSSEFEIVGAEDKKSSQDTSRKSDIESLQNEESNLTLYLQRLENTISLFAEESDKNQLFAHLGRMALEFNRLSSKVHKNEQRTSILQSLCEQLRQENEELRAKLEKELEQRNQASQKLRCENLELKKMVMVGSKEGESTESAGQQQKGATVEKATGKIILGTSEKKVKILEHQRNELLEVNKQWDQHFRSMKQQYEQKITDLRQKLADSQKAQGELEAEREQKQRDFDRKLLLAKSKIEEEEGEKERLSGEGRELKQRVKFLQDQLTPVTRQREYQEKEILRLNKALEEALNFQASAPSPSAFNNSTESSLSIRHQEVMTQNELLKQQVKIFEEDFQRERSDRERMNEEKEELKQQLEKLQKQLMLTSNQLRIFKEDYQKEREEKDKFKKLYKQQKQQSGDRLHPEPQPGPVAPVCPMYQFQYSPPVQPHMFHGYEDWQQIRYPPSAMANERVPVQNYHRFPPPEYTWCPPCVRSPNHNSQAVEDVKQLAKESDPPNQRPT